MNRNDLIFALFAVATLAILGVASLVGVDSLWGFNHLQFLSGIFATLFGVVMLAVLYLTAGPIPDRQLDEIIADVDNFLWDKDRLPRMAVAVGAVAVFFLFQVETHLLGDGYTWLAVFGHGESYIHKWTEPGSILLLRATQNLLGGFTKETALRSFQIFSILSGGVFVYSVIGIVGQLCAEARGRILGVATLLFSGAMLLFFGYVEFYPLVWAAIAVFVNMSLSYMRTGRGLWLALIAFAVAALMHVQALFLLPGVCYLVVHRIKYPILRRIGWYLSASGAVAVIGAAIWTYQNMVEFEIMILPPFTGRPVAPDFTILSAAYLYELLNLVLLMIPGILMLGALWWPGGKKSFDDAISRFLGFLSIGSLLFLALFGAAITMGRDWDVMSLALFAPMLLMACQIGRGTRVSTRAVLVYCLVTAFVTLSFLAVNTRTESTEERFHTLLNERSRNGWVIYANYFHFKGDDARHRQIMEEMDRHFPDYGLLKKAHDHLENGELSEAEELAGELVERDPYQADFLQIMANVHGKNRRFEQSEQMYLKALKLSPYQPTIMNELGQLYINMRQFQKATAVLSEAHYISPERTFITESLALAHIYRQQFDTANALAESLFRVDPNSPGAHLIMLTVALNRGHQGEARVHYESFLALGEGRSDYENIRQYYHYLVQ